MSSSTKVRCDWKTVALGISALFIVVSMLSFPISRRFLFAVGNGQNPAWLHSVSFGNGRFVAVGDDGTIMVSRDGNVWSTTVIGPTDLYAVTWGDGNRFYASSGLDEEWQQTILAGPITDLASGDGLIVGVGQQGLTLTSEDGQAWRVRPTGVRSHLASVVYGNKTFVAVGDFGTIIASTNGVSWHEPTKPLSRVTTGKEFDLVGLAYGSGKYVAVGNYGSLLTSEHGEDWVLQPMDTFIPFVDVAFGSDRFVAVGMRGMVRLSTDGVKWRTVQLQQDSWACCTAVAAGKNGFVILGSGRVWTSQDAETWQLHAIDLDASTVRFVNGQYVGVGSEYVYTSPDGVHWEPHLAWKKYQGLRGLTDGAGQLVAVGTYGTIATSTDGTHWSERISLFKTPELPVDWLNGVAYGRDHFVAVGNNGSVLTSSDGQSWRPSRVTETNLLRVVYGRDRFVAVGELGTTIWSPDGETWYGSEVLPSEGVPGEAVMYRACGSVGERVAIRGFHLSGAAAWFGEMKAHTEGSGSHLLTYVPAGAQSGPVTLRWDNGRSVVVASHFEVTPVSIDHITVTQGVEGFPLIWGKQTLVQVFPAVSREATCPAQVDGGTLFVEFADGTRKGPYIGIAGRKRPVIAVNPWDAATGEANRAINFILPSNTFQGSPADLSTVTISLTTNGHVVVEVPATTINQLATFRTIDTHDRPFRAIVAYFSVQGVPRDPMWQRDLARTLNTFARTYPVRGEADNLFTQVYDYELPEAVSLDSETLMRLTPVMNSALAKFNQGKAPDEQARLVAGIIDRTAFAGGKGVGIAWMGGMHSLIPERAVSVSLNGLGDVLGQEVGHNYGLLPDMAPNAASYSRAHSRYDDGIEVEGGKFVFKKCVVDRTFGQSLLDQMPDKPTVTQHVTNTVDLWDFTAEPSCGDPAKSIMSYAPFSANYNAFLEYSDYMYLLEAMEGTPPQARMDDRKVARVFAEMAQAEPAKVLYMTGLISADGKVTVASSWVEDGRPDKQTPDSPYAAVFKDKSGTVLGRHPFYVSFTTSESGSGTGAHQADASPFGFHASFPSQTHQVEIHHFDKVLATFQVPEVGPKVEITSPVNKAHVTAPLDMAWKAMAPAGTRLFTDVSASNDGGKTFTPAAVLVEGESVTILSANLPSGTVLLRVQVSDGFNVAEDTVEVWVEPRPLEPAIIQPEPGAVLQANVPVTLSGSVIVPGGGWMKPSDITWSSDLDGELGTGDFVTVRLSKGTHRLTLKATKDGYAPGIATITVTVRDSLWCGTVFPDVPAHLHGCPAIEKLAARKIISGYPDGTFKPDQTVTRAEFAKLLVLAMGKLPDPEARIPFTDAQGHWAAQQGYLQVALAMRAINGYPDGTFRPNDPITRAEVIKITAAAAGLTPRVPAPYADVEETAWFGGWVGAAYAYNLIGPSATTELWPYAPLAADQPVTRAEAAIILDNMVER